MDVLPYIATLLSLIIVLAVIRVWLNRVEQNARTPQEIVEWLKQVSESNRHVDTKLSESMHSFNKRLDNAAEAMMGVQKKIGEFSEIGRSMQELQSYLQSPKLRGSIGEHVLKELLSQCLPPDLFSLQFSFQNGERVDAVIKTSQGLISIDSKFPLTQFKGMMSASSEVAKEEARKEFVKDVKKHIASISKKYILVSEGTLDYALMYIPSESVYYEIINQADLFDYASSLRIVPVSPMSFYAYLKVILISHEGAHIQKQAKEILTILTGMRSDYQKTEESLGLLHKHLGNAVNQSSQSIHYLGKLGQKLESTSSLSQGTKPLSLHSPDAV